MSSNQHATQGQRATPAPCCWPHRMIQEFEERLCIVEGRVATLERGGSGAGGASSGSGSGSAQHEEALLRLSARLSKLEGASGGGVDMNPRQMVRGGAAACC
jgi:hypothetical protein